MSNYDTNGTVVDGPVCIRIEEWVLEIGRWKGDPIN
jgi:hypothetical protein